MGGMQLSYMPMLPVLHDSMLCTWSTVTSVTWWLPVVTMCYQHYQVLHDSMLCTWSTVTSVTWWLPVYGYYVLPALPGIACCVLLPQLLCGYQWLPLATGVTWYCRTLGCIHSVLVNTVFSN